MTEEHRDLTSPGRRDYDNLVNDLEDHITGTDRRLRKFFIGALAVLAIIGFSTAASIAGFGIVLHEQQQTSDQQQKTAKQLAKLVVQNKQFTKDIQKQRRESIREACREQTRKHDKTVNALMKGSNLDQKNAPNAAARKEIRRRRDVTIGLIDALAPAENCEQKVKEAVQGG